MARGRGGRLGWREIGTFEFLLALLAGAVALSALAKRLDVPYPTLLALAGAALALSPVHVPLTVDPTSSGRCFWRRCFCRIGDLGDDAFHRVEEELDFAGLAVRQES